MTTLKNGLFFSKRKTSLPLPCNAGQKETENAQLSEMTSCGKEEETAKRRRGGMCKQESFQDKVQPTRISRFKSLLINANLKILLETASWPNPWEIKI